MQIDLATIVSMSSSLACGIVGLVVFRRLPLPLRLLVVHAFLAFAMDVWGFMSIQFFSFRNNQVFYNFYMPVDFLLLLFATRIKFGKHFRLFSAISIAIFIVLWTLSISVNGIYQFANHVLIAY